MATAERMGYHRNELAVNFRQQSTHNIGIIIPEIVTTFYMHKKTVIKNRKNDSPFSVSRFFGFNIKKMGNSGYALALKGRGGRHKRAC